MYFSMALIREALGTAPMMVSIFLPSLKIITYHVARIRQGHNKQDLSLAWAEVLAGLGLRMHIHTPDEA